jgi:hypothetical protein
MPGLWGISSVLSNKDISYRRFTVVGSDPYRFDGGDDRVGCVS